MTRLLFGFVLLGAVIGCTNIQPAGPFAKSGGASGGGSKQDKDLAQSEPVVIPAQTPTPPKCLVQASDVTAENTDWSQQQLQAEFDFDRKNMPSVPVTAEISHVK
jgi:hypothetical protein